MTRRGKTRVDDAKAELLSAGVGPEGCLLVIKRLSLNSIFLPSSLLSHNISTVGVGAIKVHSRF
jgi:hypothetical protein